jgi:hypothetical protein
MKALLEPFTEKPSFLRFFIGCLLVPSPVAWVTDREIPFNRWFFYLFTGTLLTLLAPIVASPQVSYHSPHLNFFTQGVAGQRIPAEDIWMNGPTHAMFDAHKWLVLALSLIFLETFVGTIRWLWIRHSSRS